MTPIAEGTSPLDMLQHPRHEAAQKGAAGADHAAAAVHERRGRIRVPEGPPRSGARCRDRPERVQPGSHKVTALAERWYGTRLTDFIYVSGEIGVGVGFVPGAELFRGARGFAGEVGHVQVNPAGPTCGCGNRGCLEQVAGKYAVLRAPAAAGEDQLSRHAEAGDRRTLAALARTASALAVAVSAVINVVDVLAVVLGGFIARLGGWLAEPLAAELSYRVVSPSLVEVRYLISAPKQRCWGRQTAS